MMSAIAPATRIPFTFGLSGLIDSELGGAGDRSKGTTGSVNWRRLAPDLGRLDGRLGTELDNRRLIE